MTVAVPEGLGALQRLAENQPELADRVASLVVGLLRVEPVTGDPRWNRAEDEVESLRSLGVVEDDEPGESADPGSALSDLAHRALDRSLVPDFERPRLEVADNVMRLADALGWAFKPYPSKLLDIFQRVAEIESDLRPRIAWLAARGGADALVDGLADALAHDSAPVLDLLQAVLDTETWGLLRPPGAFAAPPSAPMPDVIVMPGPSADVQWSRAGTLRRVVGGALNVLRGPFRRDPMAESPVYVPPPGTPPPPPSDGGAAVVSTGFAPERGAEGLPVERTLSQGRRYQFFVQISRQLASDAIETSAVPLPELPVGTVLQVALFGFDGELAPEPGADVGELRLVGDGSAVVETQPGGAVPGQRRLYLTVATPNHPGVLRMRCNIYCRQVLLQSRLVEVQVTDEERTVGGPALRSVVDFAVVSDLRPEHVEALEARTLSVLVNDNGDGTHGFRFFAGTEFKHDATLNGQALAETLEQTRAGLRLASWATAIEPTRAEFAKLSYRYSSPTAEHLVEDMILLARSGFIVWDALVDQLAGDAVDDLRERMKTPGLIELANKESLDLLVPAACLYDYPLDPEAASLTVCPDFLAARGVTPLADTPCFQGHCPKYELPSVVCPSGFWGFRHQIGYSASLTGGETDDAHNHALAIPAGLTPVFTVGASADRELTHRDGHLKRVRDLVGGQWNFAWGRTDLFALFKTTAPSVVYLYGHGGKQGRAAFFEVGSGADGPIIRASLRGKADWRTTRPLVFLNGCHSAALAPDAAFSYATGFLQTAHASAVVGTEIAVFEKLAVAFAEDCLRRFVVDRQPLGQAVRGARLALLEQGVPLGLVYLAFGPSELRLAA